MNQYNYYYKIVDLIIHVKVPYEIMIEHESENFICEKEKEEILIEFIEIQNPLSIEGFFLLRNRAKIYIIENKFIHEFCLGINEKPYAWLIPMNSCNYELKYLKGREKNLKYSRNILEVIDIENILNKFNAFILHCSFIKYNDKAILFSAPSGTGKSTQAELWNKYENAEIINGDRAGIRKVDNKWTAYGLPFAGSSRIFKNEKAPISHIIILHQGKENKIHRLSPRDAFIKIYSETTIHTWDEDFQKNVIEQITDLVQNVPVYLYECLPDKSAVDFLKEVIGGENNETKINRT